MKEIAEIKHSGIAFDDGEFNPEVRCIAVPVMDFTGQTVGALGISGPIWRLSIQALQNHARTMRAAANRLSAEFGAKERREIFLTTTPWRAFGVDSGPLRPEISSNIRKTSLTFSHTPEWKGDIAETPFGRRPTMTRTSRRTLLKGSAAFAGAAAIGFPAISYGQSEKIKIGHLTPLTGFLGALGAYAQLGIRMAEEEINRAGGVMGRQIDITSEDSVNPATAATKAQRMLDQDGATVLMGEINSRPPRSPSCRSPNATRSCSCRSARAPTRCAARTATSTPSTSTSPPPSWSTRSARRWCATT